MIAFERLQLAKELVVFPIRDSRTIENVVVVVGALDGLPQRAGACCQRGIDGQKAVPPTYPLASSPITCIATVTSRSSSSSEAFGNSDSAHRCSSLLV